MEGFESFSRDDARNERVMDFEIFIDEKRMMIGNLKKKGKTYVLEIQAFFEEKYKDAFGLKAFLLLF